MNQSWRFISFLDIILKLLELKKAGRNASLY